MISLDTNVLVRLLVGDDPEQTALAESAFLEHTAGGGVFVHQIALVETAWVLRSGYRLDRAVVHARLERLVRTRGVFVEEVDLVLTALDEYARGLGDFADLLLVSAVAAVGATPLLTFDQKLAGHEHASLLSRSARP